VGFSTNDALRGTGNVAAKLQAMYPPVRVDSDRIYLNERAVWTSAGMMAGIDMALAFHLIAGPRGRARAGGEPEGPRRFSGMPHGYCCQWLNIIDRQGRKNGLPSAVGKPAALDKGPFARYESFRP